MRKLFFLIFTSGLGQLLVLASTPILSRLYSPELFGELGLVISVSGILGIILTMRLEQTLLASDQSANAVSESKTIIVISSLLALFSISAVLLIRPDNMSIFILIVAGGYMVGLFSIVRFFLIMDKEYRKSGFMNIFRAVFQPAIQFGLFSFKSGLSLGWVVGFLPAIYYGGSVLISSRSRYYPLFGFLRDKWKFIKYAFPAAIMSEITVGFLIYSTYVWYGKYEAGIVAIVYRLLGFPVQLFARSISEYLSPIYRDIFQKERTEFGRLLLPFGIMMSVLFFLIVTFLSVPGSWYVYILGDEWSEAKKYFVIMLPLFCVRSLAVCLSPVYIASGKQFLYFIFMFIMCLSFFCLLYFSVKSEFDFYLYLEIFVMLGSVIYTAYSLSATFLLWRKK